MSAPAINFKKPDSNETNVYINTTIQVRFDQAMDSGTINTDTMQVYRTLDLSPLVVTVTYDTTTYTATILSSAVLLKNTQYSVVITGDDPSTTVVENAVKNVLGVAMQSNTTWNFQTGTEVYYAPEDTQPETQPDQPVASQPTQEMLIPAVETKFSITDVIPDNYATNLDINLDKVSIYFNKPIASGHLDSSWVTLEANPVLGETPDLVATAVPSGYLSTTPSGVHWNKYGGSGNVFKENNEILITVSKGVTTSGGLELEADEQFMFTTRFNPLYSTVKKVRLEAGPLLAGSPDDTLNRSIHENSLLAYNLANPDLSNPYWDISSPTFAATQFVKCKAGNDLLNDHLTAMLQGLGGSKRLGDLSVQNIPGIANEMQVALGKTANCVKYWIKKLTRWSRATPKGVVKGATSLYSPPIRGTRTWKSDEGETSIGGNLRQGRLTKLPGRLDLWS